MTDFKRAYPVLLCSAAFAGFLTGCDTTSYEELEITEARTGAFSAALASEYRQFAKSEIDQYDWPDQQHIARKGLQAAKGQQPLPEATQNWRLQDDDKAVLAAHRENLIHWLNTDARQTSPIRSAKAQARFDCWMEQQEENWQIDHIKTCKDGFVENLPEISQVQFAFDSAILDIKALEALRKIARDWQNKPGELLLLQGHTDKIGSERYNYRLSRKRAFAVKSSLIAFGLPQDRIQVEIWGKTRPRLERLNASTAQTNRRVEILKF